MRTHFIIAATILAAAGGVAAHSYAGSRTPAGQAPLVDLTPQNVSRIKDEFNAGGADVRILLLFSPT